MEKQIANIRYRMIGLIAGILLLGGWQWHFVLEGVMAHFWIAMSIFSAFAFSIVMAFVFVFKLQNEVIAFKALKEMWDDIRVSPAEDGRDPLWRHYRCAEPARVFKRPRLLGQSYDLVTDELARTKKIRLSVETMNTLVHKIGQTIDDERSLLVYMSGMLVFMGLIGTFIGLLHMVGSIGTIIGSLGSSSGDSGSAEAFQQLLGALQEPLKGMASGFASSLFGLFSSLAVGLLGRWAGQAAGVLKHEFEAWLASVVEIGGEESADRKASKAGVAAANMDASMLQLVSGILADYSKVAGSFDHVARLLRDVQAGQDKQLGLMDQVARNLARTSENDGKASEPALAETMQDLTKGLNVLTTTISKTVATELEATRMMMQDMHHSHSSNISILANNQAQTAVQMARALERVAPLSESMVPSIVAGVSSRIDNMVNAAIQPVGETVREQMQSLERAFGRPQYDQEAAARQKLEVESNAALIQSETARTLETNITNRLDQLNSNIGTAFSAYSGILKLAVAALEKSDASQPQAADVPKQASSANAVRTAG